MSSDTNFVDFSMVLSSSVHDMKNSLTMLLGSISEITAQCTANTCPMHDNLYMMQHEAQRVNQDLFLLLTLYKTDQKKYFLNVDEINLYEHLTEIIIEAENLFKGYGISMLLQCNTELTGFFDKNLVASIIKTIISNAYLHTMNCITITANNINGYARICVIDNGDGYPDKMMHNGLSPTGTVDFGTGSTGLGLYFLSRVAELHKNKDKVGYIQINNNTQPIGGRFSIFLP